MASMGDGVEVYTSDGPCGAASTQYRGLVMVSKVKSRNAFSDIRCVVHTSEDREVRGKRCLFVFVKLRRGSGKDRQGMAPKAKGLKA